MAASPVFQDLQATGGLWVVGRSLSSVKMRRDRLGRPWTRCHVNRGSCLTARVHMSLSSAASERGKEEWAVSR